MVACAKCGKALDAKGKSARVAGMSGSIMGDECTDTYYFCDECGTYMLELYRDNFQGDESASVRGPFSKQEAEPRIAIMRRCSEPWDKKCRCEAHREYFGGWLD